MTGPDLPARADMWRDIHERLVRYAGSLGIGADDAQDVAQETIGRAIARAVPFVDAEDLLRWCQAVARNQAMDEHRRRRRVLVAPDGLAGQRSSADDVAEIVASRDMLSRALSALTRLPEAQREAMLSVARDEMAPTADRRAQVRLAVARSRARASLRSAIGYGPSAVAVLVAAVRRATRAAPTVTAATVAVVAAWMAALPPASDAKPTPRLSIGAIRVAAHVSGRPVRAPRPRRVAGVGNASRVRAPSRHRTPPAGRPIAAVHGGGLVAAAAQRPQRPGDHTLCVQGGPLPSAVCIG